ncbi:DNA polymerase III subunit epsilon [Iodidimonas gelatinilytica]|uniref:DNA polymerase III subunit epsilon n=1 Tax=Iodidimonas gelatinilytica TaxID=1236966 RepID=A0A5A7MQK7_9PROT|nr:DNA polymerase III subunit epsilon [Iodidimonas gelatinilytica]GEQ97493.1 DNA polymerase III subunit epsilon [Iodidimonas gelatinilytica]
MREIVFDTETTGLDPSQGHRLVQIGAVELIDFLPTGREYMTLINPMRPMDPGAAAVHGITDAMLEGQPIFDAVIDDFLAFVDGANLVAHNADFDMKFLNFELKKIQRPVLPKTRFVDTLEIARRRFPGQKLSLDALCKRLGVDNSMREHHDALLDCQILAEVYLELRGGRQHGLGFQAGGRAKKNLATNGPAFDKPIRRDPRPHAPNEAELAAHQAFIKRLKSPIWEN